MRVSIAILLAGCLTSSACAQTKSARDFYYEATAAGNLPSLPYACFRSSEIASYDWKERPYTDPTFVMLGSTKQIAEIIRRKLPKDISKAEGEQFQQFQNVDSLYVASFDHGVPGKDQMYDRQDPNDPSRAGWVLASTIGPEKKPLTWTFNINWGTLRFKETLQMGSDSLTYYGSCVLTGHGL